MELINYLNETKRDKTKDKDEGKRIVIYDCDSICRECGIYKLWTKHQT